MYKITFMNWDVLTEWPVNKLMLALSITLPDKITHYILSAYILLNNKLVCKHF